MNSIVDDLLLDASAAPEARLDAIGAVAQVGDLRFAGIDRLYGAGTVVRLSRAHACIVGVGGVGSWAAEALVRSGIGELTLIDADDVCVSNTNRQSHALEGAYGRPKVAVLGERLRAINPTLRLHAIEDFLTLRNLADLIGRAESRPYSAVLDACDALRIKVEMIAFCRRRKLPIVVSGSAGGRRDPTLVTARDLSRTEHDALLGAVRKKLRDDHAWTRNPKRYFGVQAVFSRENVNGDGRYDTEGMCSTSADGALRLDCSGGLGAAMHVTASFGMIAAARVIEKILAAPRGPVQAPERLATA